MCTVPQEDIGLAWDGVCFAFLILQRRLFHSYYFYRVIDESKATTVLASRYLTRSFEIYTNNYVLIIEYNVIHYFIEVQN